MDSRLTTVFAISLLILSLVGCSESNGAESDGPIGSSGPASGIGPGISVAEALKSKLDEPLLVNGWLVVLSSNETRLCTSLTGATPPGCGQPSLLVKDLDLSSIADIRREQGRAWSEKAVQLLGDLKDGTLKVSPRSRS